MSTPSSGHVLAAYVCAALFLSAAGFCLIQGFLLYVLFGLYALLFALTGLLMQRIPRVTETSPAWKLLERWAPKLQAWAPVMGVLIGLCFLATAVFWYSQEDRTSLILRTSVQRSHRPALLHVDCWLLIWVNLFWGLAFLVAGFLVRLLGIRRAMALGCLLSGSLYTVATVFWFEQGSSLFMWLNIPWGLWFILVGFFIDRKRDVARELP